MRLDLEAHKILPFRHVNLLERPPFPDRIAVVKRRFWRVARRGPPWRPNGRKSPPAKGDLGIVAGQDLQADVSVEQIRLRQDLFH